MPRRPGRLFFVTLGCLAGCTGNSLSSVQREGRQPEVELKRTADGKRYPVPALQIRRLTKEQYNNSISSAFGGMSVEVHLPEDRSTERFTSIGASQVATAPYAVELYRDAALAVADAVLARRAELPKLAACADSSATQACIRAAVEHYGQLLWRRPLSAEEVERYTAIALVGGDNADTAAQGLRYSLAGLLQSPHFLYLTEVGVPVEGGELRQYTAYELASRLSFLLWNGPPDAALLESAAAGTLTDVEELERHTARMLKDERARDLGTRFFAEAWKVSGLDVSRHDPAEFPEWDEQLVSSYLQEFRRVLEDLTFSRNGDLREVFTSRRSFINPRLGRLYGVTTAEAGFNATELGPERSGLLTSGAVIAANSASKYFLPTHRGVFVAERVLCKEPPAPSEEAIRAAEELEAELAASGATLTPREIVEQHSNSPACSGCHSLFDPVGYTFSEFNHIGQYQKEQGGKPVDATGTFMGAPLNGAAELGKWVSAQKDSTHCLVRNFYSFAIGAEPPHHDPNIDDAHHTFGAEGHPFSALVLSVVKSPGFRFAAVTTSEGANP